MKKHTQNRRHFMKMFTLGALSGGMVKSDSLAWKGPLSTPIQGVASKIKSVEVRINHKSNPVPVRDALQTLPGVGNVEVILTSDDGIQGTGSIYFGRIDKSLETLKALIENELVPVVSGTNLSRIRQNYEKMVFETDYHGTSGLATFGIAAIDTASWDCMGKTLNVPCWQIWGGCHDSIPAYGMLGWLNFDETELRKRCEQALKQGYRALKLKVGYPLLEADIRRIKLVREIIGDEIRLMVDANQALTVGEAIMRGRAFEDLGCYWFEEPVPAHDLEGYKRISRELAIQLATGENLQGPHDFSRFIKNDAVDIVQPDLRRSGGPTALLEIGHTAHAFNIPYASHGSGAVHMNVMACLPNTIYVETGGNDQLVDGRLKVPQGPGFSWA